MPGRMLSAGRACRAGQYILTGATDNASDTTPSSGIPSLDFSTPSSGASSVTPSSSDPGCVSHTAEKTLQQQLQRSMVVVSGREARELPPGLTVKNTFIEGYDSEDDGESADLPLMVAAKSCPVAQSQSAHSDFASASQSLASVAEGRCAGRDVAYVKPSLLLERALQQQPRKSDSVLDAVHALYGGYLEDGPVKAVAESAEIEPIEVRKPRWSIGSVGHKDLLCKPCAWYWRPQGCTNGAECRHCHMCMAGEGKARRKMKLASLRSQTGWEDFSTQGSCAALGPQLAAKGSNIAGVSSVAPTLLRKASNDESMPLMTGVKSCPPLYSGRIQAPWRSLSAQTGDLCRSFESSASLCLETAASAPKRPSLDRQNSTDEDRGMWVRKEYSDGTETTKTTSEKSTICLDKELEPLTPSIKVKNTFIEGYASDHETEELPLMVSTKSCPARALQASELPPVMYVQPSANLSARAPTPTTPELTAPHNAATSHGISAQPTTAFLASQSTRTGLSASTTSIVALESRAPEWSIGATFHGVQQCRPCTWFWRPQGCINGESCRHCHMCPVGEVKARRKNRLAILRSSHQEAPPVATSPVPGLPGGPPPPPQSCWTSPAFLGCPTRLP